MLTRSVAFQGLKPVSRRNPKLLQALGKIEYRKLPPRGDGQVPPHCTRKIAGEDHRCPFIAKASDHDDTYSV